MAQGLPLTWARFWGNWLRENGKTGSSVEWGEYWCLEVYPSATAV